MAASGRVARLGVVHHGRQHVPADRHDAVGMTWITASGGTGPVPMTERAVSLMEDEQEETERETEADVMSGAVPSAVDAIDGVLDDATLVARARDGDLRAFEQLVRRYQRGIYQLALRMTASGADAEDITQEVFLTAWRRLPELREDAAVVGWLYRTATNRCLNLLRSRKPTSEIDEAVVASERPGDDPLRGAENSAQRAALIDALAQLQPTQRAVWLLREVHGRSYDEIAALVDTTPDAVRGRLARARAQLAERMTSWR
jgi:RNA polymerase sigma-70 factor (ECF subfamily)